MYTTTKSVNLNKLCRSVVSSNANIQSVEIINKSGLTLEKLGSDRIIKASNEERSKKNSGKCLFDISLGEEIDDLYGTIQYHFSEGNLAIMSFPLNENRVIITTTKNISPISLATRIALIIAKFNLQSYPK